MKTISVFPLLQTGSDCSRNGIVKRCADTNHCGGIMTLVSGTDNEIKEWSKKQSKKELERTLVLVKRSLWGEPYWYVEPLIKPKGIQTFGGNYVVTSDSRFKEYSIMGLPLPAHDRFDSQEEYNRMCI